MMGSATRPGIVRFLATVSRAASFAVVAIGAFVLAGWIFDIGVLKSVHPALVRMKANTAIGFLLTGSRLILRSPSPRSGAWTRALLSGAVLVVGALTLLEYVSRRNLGIDQALFADPEQVAYPGRMSPVTAVNFVLLGTALLLRGTGRSGRASDAPTLIVACSTLLTLLGYAYGVRTLYVLGPFTAVAVHTAAGFAACVIALLFAAPEEGLMAFVATDGPGGVLARQMLPACLIVPAFLGWLALEGKRAALYDTDLALALLASSSIMCFSAIVWWSAAGISRSDGARRQAEATASARADDLAATLDRMRETERALVKSQALFARIAESGIAGIVVSDELGRITTANDAFLRMIGYCRDDLESGRLHAADLTPADWQAAQDVARAQLNASGTTEPWQKEFVRKDGTRIPVLVAVARLEAQSLVSVVADLSALKRAEVALQHTEEQLRHAQKMEAIGRLAGGIAHDFNNLLSVILSNCHLMIGELGDGDPRRSDVDEIRRAAQRAADLTRQLLMFSRQQVLAPQVLDLNDVLVEMEKMVKRLVGEDIDVVVSLDRSLGKVCADPGSIEQAIMNLVVNARDAMRRGGKLTIETANAILDEDYAREHVGVTPGPHVLLAVSDTGTGMDRATQARIFEPFFTTKDLGKGTGLGLPTVFGIVSQSGGSIWVYSEVGKGATFKIYLPMVSAAATAPRSTPAPGPIPGNETILLIEDEEPVRKVARTILERCGYRVIAAQDAAAARLACETHPGPIDLVLSDVVMPEMSGPELAQHLKAIRPEIKVLFMSGYTDDAIIRHGALGAGIAFLQKPFTPSTLTSKIRDVLGGANPPPKA